MKDKISYKVYLEGVKINPWIIAFIDNPSDEITNAAIEKNKKVYGYLKNKKIKIYCNLYYTFTLRLNTIEIIITK